MARVFDLSQWQHDDAVNLIKEFGADGVVIRLGTTYQGEPYLDDKFILFVNEAVAQGIPYGIYYYSMMQDSDMALMEVQWINDRVYELLNGQEPPLGVWLDLEDSATKFEGIHELTQYAIETLKSWGFKKVGIYSGYSYIHEYFDINDLVQKQTPIWVANYDTVNWLREEDPDLNHIAWQYTDQYQGYNLDCNEWYGVI